MLEERNTYTSMNTPPVHSNCEHHLNMTKGRSSDDVLKTFSNNSEVDLLQHTGEHKVIMYVYVLNKDGIPMMPCKPAKARHLIQSKKAKVVRRKPFTIQLLWNCENNIQDINLDVDSGYSHIGLSSKTEKKEIFSVDVSLRTDIPSLLQKRSMYRKTRRNKLRYRKPRFDNRATSIKCLKCEYKWKYKKRKGQKKIEYTTCPKCSYKYNICLPPSLLHKLESHIRFINFVKSILPIKNENITIEAASFDVQKIKDPDIYGKEYQEGELLFWNLREYILYRDNHKCQNPNCPNKNKKQILQSHHIDFNRKNNKITNLITLCADCNHPKNHKKGNFLYEWKIKNKKAKSYISAAFMNNIRWCIVNYFQCNHTYGYITKDKRIRLGLKKSHINDAFAISGNKQDRCKSFSVVQVRRNNRSLQKFYDAKYIDIRSGKIKAGLEIGSPRHKRTKIINGIVLNKHHHDFLRKFRGKRTKEGRVSIRKKRYKIQPHDLIKCKNDIVIKDKIVLKKGDIAFCKGAHSNGRYYWIDVKINGIKPYAKYDNIKLIKHGKGFCFV